MLEATGFWSKLFRLMLPELMLGSSSKKDMKLSEKAKIVKKLHLLVLALLG
jgi:hypothetical protein